MYFQGLKSLNSLFKMQEKLLQCIKMKSERFHWVKVSHFNTLVNKITKQIHKNKFSKTLTQRTIYFL